VLKITSSSQTCLTRGELLESIPGSCQHCVPDDFSKVLLCLWIGFINCVLQTSPQISHMESHRVNTDTQEDLNITSTKMLHKATTKLLAVWEAALPCWCKLHSLTISPKLSKLVREFVQCTYLHLLFPKKIGLIIPVAQTAHHALPLISYNGTSCNITLGLRAELRYNHMDFRKILYWEFLLNVVDTFYFWLKSDKNSRHFTKRLAYCNLN
jgi:hypothetical protein